MQNHFLGSIMNNFDEWSQIISKYLKSEADFLTTVAKHEVEVNPSREAFIRNVLELFLPGSYAIGSGLVIDSAGQSSKKLDLVIYRRDFPRLNLPGSVDMFLYESVLATIEVRPKLVRKTLFDALDACASLSELNPAISEAVLANLAEKNDLARNPKGHYVHEDPLITARFNLLGRPPSFVYGFNGFKTSFNQLAENIEVWIEDRRQKNLNIEMKSFPAIIATQGCFGCRNAAPLSAKRNHLFGIGVDDAPIRLIVLHLLYALNRRLRITPDGYGLKPGLDAYLMNMAPPKIQYTTGRATNAVIKAGAIAEEIVESPANEEPAKAVSESVPGATVVEEEVVDSIVNDEPNAGESTAAEPVKAGPESVPTAAVVEEEVVDSIVDDEPNAGESTAAEPVKAVFETIPTATVEELEAGTEIIVTPVDTSDGNKSFDPFAELEADANDTEAEVIDDPLIDTGLVEAAAVAGPAEHVFEEEEAYDPFAEMELVDPEAENTPVDAGTDKEFSETVKITKADADSEAKFAKTVIMTTADVESIKKDKKPAFEQDFISTPAAPNQKNQAANSTSQRPADKDLLC
jgi:hypothetical protein